jgi:GNAT superfamily N-acetyltransferase
MKADMADGEVVGFAIWAFGGFEHVFEGEDVAAPAAPVIKKDQQQDQEGKEEEKEDEVQEESKTKTKIQELAEITNASMKEWQARLMPPGSRCIVLVAISVLPDYQGQGVGSALIKWGTEIADREGVYCWVSSSDKGWGAFQKMGFREVERLSINLDDFADEGIRNERREDGKWGDYTFHYMRREAGASHVGQLKR